MVLFGDIVIGAAAFMAGWYFAPYVQSAVDWVKAVYGWIKARVG